MSKTKNKNRRQEMKSKLSTLGFVLILSALIVSGCGPTTKVAVDVPDVEVAVDVPEVKVDVDVPNVEVTVPDVRVAVDVPAVEVDVPDVEVAVDAPDVIRGSGNVVTEDRPVSDFNRVSLIGVGDVIITQGEEESLTVGADDNLMQYIKTEVKNGTLILGFTDEVKSESVKPSEAIRFNLSVKEIAELHIGSSGYIRAASLDTDRLEIVIGEAADVNIGSLTAEELVLRIGGVGNAERRVRWWNRIFTSLAGATIAPQSWRAKRPPSRSSGQAVSPSGQPTPWMCRSPGRAMWHTMAAPVSPRRSLALG
jgi:hypothetical protein